MASQENDEDVAPASNDAYTGMLTISLFVLIGASILLWLDFSQYGDTKPPDLPKPPPFAKLPPAVETPQFVDEVKPEVKPDQKPADPAPADNQPVDPAPQPIQPGDANPAPGNNPK